MELVKIAFAIDATAEKVWELFADFGRIDRLLPPDGVPPLPPITRVDLAGEGVGSIRTVHLDGGGQAVERLTRCDADALVVAYDALALPIGVEDYSAHIDFRRDGPERTTVIYTAQGTPTYMTEAELRATLTELFTALLTGARNIAEQHVGTA